MTRLASWLLRPAPILPPPVVRIASRAKASQYAVRSWHRTRPLVRPIASELGMNPEVISWRSLVARAGLTVLALEATGSKTIVVKIAWAHDAARQIEREAQALHELQEDPRMADVRELVPRLVARGSTQGRPWVAQSHLAGDPTPIDRMQDAVVRSTIDAITRLHRVSEVEATGSELDRIVAAPVARLGQCYPQAERALTDIGRRAIPYLVADSTRVGRIHGDLAPGNVLWDERTGDLTGLVDWELSDTALPAEIDLAHFVLAYTCEVGRLDYGRLVARTLAGDWSAISAPARALLDGPNRWPAELSVAVAWLHHIAANLEKSAHYRANSIWFNANVAPVLDVLDRGAGNGIF